MCVLGSLTRTLLTLLRAIQIQLSNCLQLNDDIVLVAVIAVTDDGVLGWLVGWLGMCLR